MDRCPNCGQLLGPDIEIYRRARIDHIIFLWREGLVYKTIGLRMGISQSRVCDILNRELGQYPSLRRGRV